MEDAPLVVWMSGGPGCSSLLAAMMENGPCKVSRNENGEAVADPSLYAWNEKANVLWVDQPAGVGFSYDENVEGDTSMFSYDQVATNMIAFLHRWEERFPSSHNGELFIFAESFGGHYAPAVGRRVFDSQQAGKSVPGLTLKGIGVGNGLTNPTIQYRYASEFAYRNTYGIKAVNKTTYEKMNAALPECEEKIRKCNEDENEESNGCIDAFVFCNQALQMPYMASGRNIYDVRDTGNYQDDLAAVTEFVNSDKVKGALDAREQPFTACNMNVYVRFLFDWMKVRGELAQKAPSKNRRRQQQVTEIFCP